jgi:hypothetical protein
MLRPQFQQQLRPPHQPKSLDDDAYGRERGGCESPVLRQAGRVPSEAFSGLQAAIPILESERLRLRGHRLEDYENCAALWGDLEVTRYIGGRPLTREEVGHGCCDTPGTGSGWDMGSGWPKRNPRESLLVS